MNLQITGLGVMIYMTVLGMTMVFVFMESRLPPRQSAMVVYAVTILLIIGEIILGKAVSIETLIRLYILIVHLPALLVFLALSRYRGWRMVFQMLSAVLFCTLIHHIAGAVYYVTGYFWTILVTYIVLSPLCIWLLYAYLRPLVFQVLMELHHGWCFICLVIFVYYWMVIYLIPGYVGIDGSGTLLKSAFSFLMAGFYCLLILLFSRVKNEAENRFQAQLTELSLSELKNRIETMQRAEEDARIWRHDLRHRFQIISELITQGKEQEALLFIDSARQQLEEQKLIQWCRAPVLNAVFSACFRQAERQGIRVDAQICMPADLKADETELALVFANALENAIHSCMEVPREQREICCKVINHPGLMFEISNSCPRDIRFDEQGLPIPSRENHGTGRYSIVNFCRKYDGVYQFTVQDGRFLLRVIL